MRPAVQPLLSDHADALLAFYRQRPPWIERWFNPFGGVDADTIERHLAATAAGEALSLGLVLPGGEIVGHAFVSRLRSDRPGFGIGLAETLIGQGFGRELMAAAMDEADRRGVARITLSVYKDNLHARRLYESFGFVNVGECECRAPGDSVAMQRLRGGAPNGNVLQAFLQIFNGDRPRPPVWTADLSYWIGGRKQDGTADPAWDTETGYLQLHRELGVLPYYYYRKFWTAQAVYSGKVAVRDEKADGKTTRCIETPRGTLRQESRFLKESCCYAVVKRMVETEDDLDVMLHALEHRRLVPANLEDYAERCRLWSEYGGLPCLGLPRSPLPAFAYEWAGLENMVMLLMDCPDKVRRALGLMEAQEAPIVDEVCRRVPPLVHFPDNLSSDNLTGYYDEHMRDRHRARLDRLHAVGIRAAVHLDGSVRGLLPKLAANGFDAVEALTPRPAGDITVEEMDALTADTDLILWGGVPGAMFAAPYTWPDMEAHVRHVLDRWGRRRFVLGVADQVPPDGDIDFCRRIGEMISAFENEESAG